MGCFSERPRRPELEINMFPHSINYYQQPNYFILLEDNEQNKKQYESQLFTFKNLTFFSTKSQLERYKHDDKNNILLVCCSNMEDIKSIRSLSNFHCFLKIGIACSFELADAVKVKQDCQKEMGFRYYRVFSNNFSQIRKFLNDTTQNESLYFCHKNSGMISRAFITFHYFFQNKDYNSSQKFLAWVQKHREMKLVEAIHTLASRQQTQKFLIQNLLAENELLLKAINILGNYKNPGIITDINWFCALIFDFIKKEYNRTLQTLNIDKFYVWIKLNNKQMEGLNSSIGQNFMFSTFMIGSFDRNYIHPESSQSNMYRIQISIPNHIKSFDKSIDLGFYIHQNKVLINLLNFFHITDIRDKVIYATYGSLAFENNLREDKDNTGFRYYRDAKKENIRMMKLYDYYCFNRQNVRNSLQLIYSLQMYQKYKQIAINWKQTGTLGNRQIQKINECLGDCEFQTQNIEGAVEYYKDLQAQQRSTLKRLYLYMKTKDGPKFTTAMKQLNNMNNIENVFLKIAVDSFCAQMNRRQSNISKAQKIIKKTIQKISDCFKNKPEFQRQSYKYYPIYLLVYKVYATILLMKGSTSSSFFQAQCEQIQSAFDGVHAIWLQ